MDWKYPYLSSSGKISKRLNSKDYSLTPIENDLISASIISRNKLIKENNVIKIPKNFFTKQRILILTSTCICCLFAIVFLITITSLYAANTDEADYGQICISKPCMTSKRLLCINQTCQCNLKEEFWNNIKCETKSLSNRAHGELCKIEYTICTSQSKCVDSICQCDPANFWDGSLCKAKKTFLDICSIRPRIDTASPNYSPTNCVSDTECLECSNSSLLYCDASSGRCMCGDINKYYFDTTLSKCMSVKTYYQSCSSTTECDQTKLLFCQKSSTGNLASCPTTSILNICDCPNGYYFDSSTSRCELKKGYQRSCITSCECDQLNKNLQCLNKMCVCGSFDGYNPLNGKCEPQG